MFALLKSNDVKAIAIAVIVIAVGLYIVFHVVSFVANNIGTILVLAAIGLIATIAWFYYQSQRV
jgi:hypothetical protein